MWTTKLFTLFKPSWIDFFSFEIKLILSTKSNPSIYRLLYAGFTLLGIALAFDPFDQTITWKARPIWQRAWLVVHLAICAGLFGMEIGLGD